MNSTLEFSQAFHLNKGFFFLQQVPQVDYELCFEIFPFIIYTPLSKKTQKCEYPKIFFSFKF